MISLISIYQKCISPFLGNRCRFHPSCSEYAKETFLHHSFFKAIYLTLWRLCRCNPLHPGGVDPVVHRHTHTTR